MSTSSTPPDPRATHPASRRELRAFGLSVGGAFGVLAALAWWRGRAGTGMGLAVLGSVLVVGGAVAPLALRRVHRVWMALAHAISRVTTPILMGIVYFGLFTPLGAVLRLTGRRPLARARSATTFWIDRPPAERRSDMRRQF
jgi:hypothetical protein